MATVPGPDPDRRPPKPDAPGIEPLEEPSEDDTRIATPEREADPSWLPEPYDPERETIDPGSPVPLP